MAYPGVGLSEVRTMAKKTAHYPYLLCVNCSDRVSVGNIIDFGRNFFLSLTPEILIYARALHSIPV